MSTALTAPRSCQSLIKLKLACQLCLSSLKSIVFLGNKFSDFEAEALTSTMRTSGALPFLRVLNVRGVLFFFMILTTIFHVCVLH